MSVSKEPPFVRTGQTPPPFVIVVGFYGQQVVITICYEITVRLDFVP